MIVNREPHMLYIETATHFRLRGCAIDGGRFTFPQDLTLRAEDGRRLALTAKLASCDSDRQGALGLPPEARLSFDLNLFDLFNSRAGNIAILDQTDTVLWELEADLMNCAAASTEAALPKETGARQIVILATPESPLLPVLNKMMFWQPGIFQKSNTAGVAVSVVPISELDQRDEDLQAHDNTILLLDEGCFTAAVRQAPVLVSRHPVLVFRDLALRQESWFGGIPQVLSEIAQLHDSSGEVALFRALTHLCGYSDLFFPSGQDLFVLHSGAPTEDVKDYCVSQLQGKATDPLVLISHDPIHDVRQLRDGPYTLMVNSRAMRTTMDVFPMAGYDFVREALRRGIAMRKVVLGPMA